MPKNASNSRPTIQKCKHSSTVTQPAHTRKLIRRSLAIAYSRLTCLRPFHLLHESQTQFNEDRLTQTASNNGFRKKRKIWGQLGDWLLNDPHVLLATASCLMEIYSWGDFLHTMISLCWAPAGKLGCSGSSCQLAPHTKRTVLQACLTHSAFCHACVPCPR